MSNINIWGRILTDEEIERMSKCFDSPMGDIFSWNDEENNWGLSNVEKLSLDTSDFCVDFPDKNYYMLPERRSLDSGNIACQVMGKFEKSRCEHSRTVSQILREINIWCRKITFLGKNFVKATFQ